MKKYSLLLLTLFTYVLTINAQSGWTQRSDYGGGEVYDSFSFVLNEKVYAGTGKKLPNIYSKDFWEFDPTGNFWVQKADFPGTGRVGARAFALNGYGYAGTGWDPTAKNDFYRYDPVTNSWTSVNSFSGSARYTATTFVVGGEGYLGMGYNPCTKDFWKYNDVTNTWTQVANCLGSSRQTAISFVINDMAYVGTGACNGTLFVDFYKYDHTINSWSQISSPTIPGRSSSFAFAIGQYGYFGLGCDYTSNSQPFSIYTDFWRYDPVVDAWSQLPDFPGIPRFHGIATATSTRGYLGMGSDTIHNTHYIQDFWEFNPNTVIGIKENELFTLKTHAAPNPVQDQLRLVATKGNSFAHYDRIEIIGIDGRIAMETSINEEEVKGGINVSGLSSGLWMYKLMRDKKILSAGKFIKL